MKGAPRNAGMLRSIGRAQRVDPLLTVDEWADKYRILSSKTGPEPGRWSTARTPYLRKIMRALSASSAVQRVALMAGAQLGKTECGNNWIGYVIHQTPGPLMIVMPTKDTIERTSRQRIDPVIEETPVLAALVAERRSRDASNTMVMKDYPGGFLVLVGANSPVGLRSTPVGFVFLDEIDAYKGSIGENINAEGDPVKLAQRGTKNFPRRKIYLCSTPLVEGSSRIEHEMNTADQLWEFRVPCPHCGHFQPLEWERFQWTPGEPSSVVYVCAACEQPIDEGRHKTRMLEAALEAPAPAEDGWWPLRHEGDESAAFKLPAFYSPYGWYSWRTMIAEYEEARAKEEAGDPSLMRIFVNTVMGRTFAEKHDAPAWRDLYNRRETYEFGTAPAGVVFLTAGVDVQKDRLEVEVVGWGRGKESWSVTYLVIEGDTALKRGEAGSPWDRLVAEVLERDWEHAHGPTLPIRVMAIDSGYATTTVYDFVRDFPQAAYGPAGPASRTPRTVVAVKGDTGAAISVLTTPKRPSLERARRRGVKVWMVGGNVITRELYGWLHLQPPTDEERAAGKAWPAGFVHYPQYGEAWFQQLVAERMVKRYHRGFPIDAFELPANMRNEALDARKYARAAAAVFGLDRFSDRKWASLERDAGLPPGRTPPPPPERPAAGASSSAPSSDPASKTDLDTRPPIKTRIDTPPPAAPPPLEPERFQAPVPPPPPDPRPAPPPPPPGRFQVPIAGRGGRRTCPW